MLQSDVACRLTSPPPNRRLHHRNRKYHNTTEHTHTHICVNFSDLLLLLLLLGCLAACPGGKLKAALLAEASVLAEVGVSKTLFRPIFNSKQKEKEEMEHPPKKKKKELLQLGLNFFFFFSTFHQNQSRSVQPDVLLSGLREEDGVPGENPHKTHG